MLRYNLLHPQILAALGSAGHGARVLIADGNYPFSTHTAPGATQVYLNLAPGLLSVTDVLKVLNTAIPIEAAAVMMPADGPEPAIFTEFRSLLGCQLDLHLMERQKFYDTACSPQTALVIATGEQRVYGNILLTIGVVTP
jgi:L-fucose mutarotase